MRHEQVHGAVPVQVAGGDGRRRLPGQRLALRECPPPVVPTDEVRAPVLGAAPVGDDDLRPIVPVQIGHGDIPRRPLRLPEGAGRPEPAPAVAEEEPLLVRPVVPRHQVEVPVPVEIGERRRVGAVGRPGDLPPLAEPAPPVVPEHHIRQRPVPPLRQHQIEIPVPVQVPDTHPGTRLRRLFEPHGSPIIRGPHGEERQNRPETTDAHRDRLCPSVPVRRAVVLDSGLGPWAYGST